MSQVSGPGASEQEFARITAPLRAKLARDPETARLTCIAALMAMTPAEEGNGTTTP